MKTKNNYDYLTRFNKPKKQTNKKTIEVEIISACPRKKKNGDDIIFLKGEVLTNRNQVLNFTYDPNFAQGIKVLETKNKVQVTFSSNKVFAPSGEEITYNNISKIEPSKHDEESDEDNGDRDELLTF